MAFNKEDSNAATPNNKDWKAGGFINIFVPTVEGKRRKLAGIPLKISDHNQSRLNDWLQEDPEHIDILRRKMIVEYQSAEQSEGSEFDLSDDVTEQIKKELTK